MYNLIIAIRFRAVAILVPLLVVNYRTQICGVSMTLHTYQIYKNMFSTLTVIRLRKAENTHTLVQSGHFPYRSVQ